MSFNKKDLKSLYHQETGNYAPGIYLSRTSNTETNKREYLEWVEEKLITLINEKDGK